MLTPSLQVAMNELSNHDHSRFLTRTNHIVGRAEHVGPKAAAEGVNHAVMREAVVVQMTWVGAPTIYYGDEAGVCGSQILTTGVHFHGEMKTKSCWNFTKR